MKNYIQEGRHIDVSAPANATSGNLVVIGSLAGVANTTVLSGESLSISCDAVFELPKSAIALAVGAPVYAAAGVAQPVTATDSDTKVGIVVRAAIIGDATVWVRISI
jgi:predicted RecA/RadA family phage recombinase